MAGTSVGRNRKVGDKGGDGKAEESRPLQKVWPTMGYVLVFLGGGIGAMLRHGINMVTPRLLGSGFPWSTFLINISGSFVMGLVAGWFAFRGDAPQHLRLFFTTGILGGYTTFSAFSLDTALLYERGDVGLAAAYVAGSVVLSIAGLFAGLWIVRSLM
jgi:CrcB protein